jgi:outer membrane protein assembly factor BamB
MKSRTLICIVATILISTSSVVAQDWPQFRGPDGNASAESKAPTNWSESENMVWKTKLPGKGSSSPIIVGDKIFLTAFSGYGMTAVPAANSGSTDRNPPKKTQGNQKGKQQGGKKNRNRQAKGRSMNYGNKADLKLHTLCLDRVSGKLLWNKSIPASANEQAMSARVYDHGYASGTPVTDGESVYAYFGVSGAVAYDLDGNQLWHNGDLGTKTAGFGSATSPAVNDDFVFINASIESGTLYALNKQTGEVAWKRENVEKSWSMPFLANNAENKTELIINQKNTVYGLDPKTGSELWSCAGIEDYVVPVPIAHDGILYCLGGRANRAMAIRLGGKGDVTKTHRLWLKPIGANVTSPLLHDGHLYWASDKGIANCMNAENGEKVYQQRMPTTERVYASIVRGSDKLYLTTRDKGVWVLDANPKFNEVSLNNIESETDLMNATPAISDGKLFLRSNTHLYCVGSK